MKKLLSGALAAATAALAMSVATASSAATIGNSFVNRATPIEFTVALPLRNEAELDRLIALQGDERSPVYQHYLTPEQFAARYGPSPVAINLAAAALRARGFAVGNLETQSFDVAGTVAQVEKTFGVRVEAAMRGDGPRLVVREPLQLPAELRAVDATILRLDAVAGPEPDSIFVPLNRSTANGPYWFTDLKQAYHAASYLVAIGAGRSIATVGDSDFSSSDAALFFRHEGLFTGSGSLGPPPKILHLLLKGYTPFDPKLTTSQEANLDVQQAAGAAPGATVTGVSVANDNFYGAYALLIKNNTYDVVSTSYGGCELQYTAAYGRNASVLIAYNKLFKQGNAQGITFVFSSGDASGLSCPQPGYFGKKTGATYKDVAAVEYWEDDPNVTSVGGTNLVTSYTKGVLLQSTYVGESENADLIGRSDPNKTGNFVSNALWGSGGGVSVVWARPAYQTAFTKVSGRSVPDVAMDMGGCFGATWTCAAGNLPSTSAVIDANGGEFEGSGGTSASAPAFAGLLAVRIGVANARLGNANTYIYKLAAANATGKYFHQGIPGKNGVVTVVKGQLGYNPITGVGTPIDTNFLLLPAAAAAGNPGSASNP